jgi:hypothetical protein
MFGRIKQDIQAVKDRDPVAEALCSLQEKIEQLRCQRAEIENGVCNCGHKNL